MDLHTVLETAAAQGTVFWFAGAAIAAGTALLVVALVLLGRRRPRRAATPARSSMVIPAAVAPVTGGSYQPARRVASPAGPEEPSLALLLRRLQAAGDRLEGIAGELAATVAPGSESGLKATLPDVEYVFKATGP